MKQTSSNFNLENEKIEELEPLDPYDYSEENKPALSDNKTGLMKIARYYSSLDSVSLELSFKYSNIPCLITDDKLKIVWENEIFETLFRTEIHKNDTHFNSLFFKDMGETTINNMIRSLKSKETHYSWQGSLHSRDANRRSIIANVLIFPVFILQKNPLPSGYTIIFDDLTADNQKMLHNMFSSLLEASKLKDNDTGSHIERVNRYSSLLAKDLKKKNTYKEVTTDFVEEIGFLAAMHDVGKIGTPDDILNKKGKLDQREWAIMKEHTINGAYILSTYPSPTAKEIALFHHEKWDGSGYPYGWSGEMIPLAARIVAIADVYDALRMKRSYKEPYTHKETTRALIKDAGTHFDPNLINNFIELQEEFRKVFDDMPD